MNPNKSNKKVLLVVIIVTFSNGAPILLKLLTPLKPQLLGQDQTQNHAIIINEPLYNISLSYPNQDNKTKNQYNKVIWRSSNEKTIINQLQGKKQTAK